MSIISRGEDFPNSKTIHPDDLESTMHSLLVTFYKALGKTCPENPDPIEGLLFEKNEYKRNQYLGMAIRMRNKYAFLSYSYGIHKDELSRITEELSSVNSTAKEVHPWTV